MKIVKLKLKPKQFEALAVACYEFSIPTPANEIDLLFLSLVPLIHRLRNNWVFRLQNGLREGKKEYPITLSPANAGLVLLICSTNTNNFLLSNLRNQINDQLWR